MLLNSKILKSGHNVSIKKISNEVQKITDEYINKIDILLETKKSDILKV